MTGQTLGHYRIVEKIGTGGMGEVFRAHDTQLDRDVAVKVLPAGTLSDESANRQFRKEALALAKLNHPNIETVHDFGAQDGIHFLVMELIPGTSVDKELQEGPLEERKILRLGLQLVEGLAAAHECGVVHRDLKPANLMVTPDGRLKILDFGLAQLLQPAQDSDMTRSFTTETGAISGTLPYMSPEQLRGLPVDARSDLYAAGAVLYEMATGQRPFPQKQSAELIGVILHQAPDAPTKYNRRITSALESVILKALEKDPAQRYHSAREFHGALEGVSAASGTTSPRTGGPPSWVAAHRSSFLAIAVSTFIVVSAAMVVGLNIGGARDRIFHHGAAMAGSTGAAPASIRARRSVAVLGFKNLSERSEEAWISTALSEMLTTELAAGEQLRAIPGENVAKMKISLSLPDTESYSKETLAKIRDNLSADDVVLGSYVPLGAGQIRVDIRLQDTHAGEILAAVSEKGAESQMDDLVGRAGAVLRQRLGVGEISAVEAAVVRATLPQSPAVARLYSEGLQKLRFSDYLGARDLLERAVAAEPKYALGHSALADAWKGLGYDGKAREEAKRAFEMSENLSREDRLSIEGQYHEMTRQWPQAIENYRTLFDFFPDNVDYGLRLASAQTSGGSGENALATVEALRRLSGPAAEDARIDLAEAAAAASRAEFERQYAAAEKAAKRADSQGARLLAAEARISQCSALRSLGKPKEAIATCEDARQIFAAAGERIGVARALNNIGASLMEQGDSEGAKKAYEAALATDRDIGDKKAQAMVLNNFADVLRDQVDLAGSRKMLEEALRDFREINDKGGVARALDNIGILLVDQGRLEEAKKRYEESLAICRELGNKSLTAYALDMLGDVYFAQGNVSAARKSYEDALAVRTELREQRTIAESRLALARVSQEEGQFLQAESEAREDVRRFENVHDTEQEALAYSVLAGALRAQRKMADAHDAIGHATELLPKGGDPSIRLSVEIEAARVLAASESPGALAAAKEDLQRAATEATKLGLTGMQFQARLALGEIEMKIGDTGAGRALLSTLERDANDRGFLLIARRAHTSGLQ